jgi:hypothetical protein
MKGMFLVLKVLLLLVLQVSDYPIFKFSVLYLTIILASQKGYFEETSIGTFLHIS